LTRNKKGNCGKQKKLKYSFHKNKSSLDDSTINTSKHTRNEKYRVRERERELVSVYLRKKERERERERRVSVKKSV